MLVQTRGGKPKNIRMTATTAGVTFRVPFVTMFLQIANEGANPVRVYWNATDLAQNDDYFTLGPTGSGTEFYEGPAELGDQDDAIYVRSEVGDSAIVVIAYQRRG